ncbi:inactive ubiquitin carboxyl-terminal hydrolase 53 [Stylonychia lemnae]|uniref:Inactive ubiquitin carboxyl-terminal hydrolase 53 n=1 Tax=Stylonychia lemnae TaxID=5949 RepID=A0A078AS17_STYLE|nr:inactive ubiquitin carboxyl-terminal hydrolase 53 [Stylonychia lemnae]|eukprot:CDW83678.1 inactive ubiquitin carboxyl-terminal hydrolase 53 [Stylonychia lemnae]
MEIDSKEANDFYLNSQMLNQNSIQSNSNHNQQPFQDHRSYQTNTFDQQMKNSTQQIDNQQKQNSLLLNREYGYKIPTQISTQNGAVDRDSFDFGLQNPRGSQNCFLNVVIQSLYRLDFFRESFYQQSIESPFFDFEVVYELKVRIFGFLLIFKKMFNEIETARMNTISGNSEIFNPNKLRQELYQKFKAQNLFPLNEKADAIEAFNQIIELVHLFCLESQLEFLNCYDHKDLRGSKSRKKACFVHQGFQINLFQIKECNCPEMQSLVKRYDQINFNQIVYVNDLINLIENTKGNNPNIYNDMSGYLFHAIKLTLNEEKSQCDQCQTKDCITQQILEVPLPKILVLNLIWSQVTCLDLMKFFITLPYYANINNLYQGYQTINQMYEIKGIVFFRYDHYYCYFQQNGVWKIYDDQLILVVDNFKQLCFDAIRIKSSPVIVFYQQTDKPVESQSLLNINEVQEMIELAKQRQAQDDMQESWSQRPPQYYYDKSGDFIMDDDNHFFDDYQNRESTYRLINPDPIGSNSNHFQRNTEYDQPNRDSIGKQMHDQSNPTTTQDNIKQGYLSRRFSQNSRMIQPSQQSRTRLNPLNNQDEIQQNNILFRESSQNFNSQRQSISRNTDLIFGKNRIGLRQTEQLAQQVQFSQMPKDSKHLQGQFSSFKQPVALQRDLNRKNPFGLRDKEEQRVEKKEIFPNQQYQRNFSFGKKYDIQIGPTENLLSRQNSLNSQVRYRGQRCSICQNDYALPNLRTCRLCTKRDDLDQKQSIYGSKKTIEERRILPENHFSRANNNESGYLQIFSRCRRRRADGRYNPDINDKCQYCNREVSECDQGSMGSCVLNQCNIF